MIETDTSLPLSEDLSSDEPAVPEPPAVVAALRVTVWTDAAAEALAYARTEATAEGTPAVFAHHLLIGLARADSGVAARVLHANGHTPDRLRTSLAFLNVNGSVVAETPEGELSPRVLRIIEFAELEAGRREHQRVRTLHLLHSTLRDRQGLPAFLLESPGVGLELVGTAIARAFRESSAEEH